MTAPAPAAPEAALTHRQILTILAGLMIGMFLAALDQTIVSTSIRTIADDLDGLSLQAWATTAYLITATITTPLYGKLSDLYGRKPLFLTAISIFVIGSVACTFAASMYQLAVFRAIQGLGAGGLFSLALTIIGDIVAPRERAKYQGYFVAVFGTSSVLGPVAGGFFAGQSDLLGLTGWRWVFLINVPLGIIALFVVSRVLNVPHTRREHRIDWPGGVALAVGLVPLLIIAEQGRSWGWASERALLCYGIGALGVVAFLLAERRLGDDALLPLRFFRNGVFGWGSVAGFVAGTAMFGAIATVPLYLQIVKGATPTEAGLQTLPLVAGIMSMSVVSGVLISRTGRYKIWPVLGIVLMAGGLVLLSRIGVDTPYWQTAIYMVIVGWGLGGQMQPLTLAVQNAMPPRDMGVATASATFFRQMGGTLGTAAFLSILFSTLPGRIAENFRAAGGDPAFRAALTDPAVLADPANAPVLDSIQGGRPAALDDSSFLAAADPRLARPILDAFATSMNLVFLVAAGLLVLGLVAVLMMKELPLRTQSGVEARREEEAAAAAETAEQEATMAAAAAAPAAVPPPVAPHHGRDPGRGGYAAAGDTGSGDRDGAVADGGPEGPADRTGRAGDAGAGPVANGSASPAAGHGAGHGAGGSGPAGGVGSASAGHGVGGSGPPGGGGPASVAHGAGGSAPANGVGGHAADLTEPPRLAEPLAGDARDRLLAMLLPDPEAAVAAIGGAERAREGVLRAQRELARQAAALAAAEEELIAQGLSREQVGELLGSPTTATPPRGAQRVEK